MALRPYIARDANNIARVEDEDNIVGIEGNRPIFLYPEKELSNSIIIIHIGLCVSSCFGEAKRNRDRLPAAILSVYKQRVWSARMRRVIIVEHYSGRTIYSQAAKWHILTERGIEGYTMFYWLFGIY